MTPPQPIPGTRAVQRALSLLSAFTEGKPTWSLTGLSAEVGLSMATAHRMLRVLEQEGYVVRPAGSADFQLGPQMIVLGALALKTVDIRQVARPELQALAKSTGEDASLESLVGSEVLILDEVRGSGLMGLATEIGTRWPAHATATGKVLLAGAEKAPTEPVGGLASITAHTITSWKTLTEALSQVRERGYATNIEELEYGYHSVAAPVRDGGGAGHRIPECGRIGAPHHGGPDPGAGPGSAEGRGPGIRASGISGPGIGLRWIPPIPIDTTTKEEHLHETDPPLSG
ncbi:IclR family transcriptional regulator [Gemmatimonadota bacterium]